MMNLITEELKFLSVLSLVERETQRIKLESILHDLPLEEMYFLDRLELLSLALNESKKLNLDRKTLSVILSRWADQDDIDIDLVIGDIAANAMCSQEILDYVCQTFENSTSATSILSTHIENRYGSGMYFGLISERVLDAYGLENLDDIAWKHLIETTENLKNSYESDPNFVRREIYNKKRDYTDILDYIESKINEKEKKKTAKVPEWVSRLSDETVEIYTNSEKMKTIGPDQNNTQMELDDLQTLTQKTTEKQSLPPTDLGDIAPITTQEVVEMCISLQHNTYSPAKEFPIERYYGPANSIISHNCIGSPIRTSEGEFVGPCRMFYCICREFDSELELEFELDEYLKPQDIWFTGFCDICYKSIRKYQHAVRFPMDGGGWIGCYCSFKCLRETKVRPLYENDESRIDQIEAILKQSGVFDF